MAGMRNLLAVSLIALAACSSQPAPSDVSQQVKPAPSAVAPPASSSSPAASTNTAAASTSEKLSADTPKTTKAGNSFIAPAGWTLSTKGPATILEAPEGGSRVAIVDVQAKDADAAVAMAWEAYGAGKKWPLKMAADGSDADGWTRIRVYNYQTSPDEKRGVGVTARFANEIWTVTIYDMARDVGEKRGAQVNLIYGRLLPKGKERESFVGKTANTLDQARIAELGKFIEMAREKLSVPGVSLGLIQGGKVVFAGGFGVRELGGKAPVDADTRYIVASNTKAMTTLMLAKLVEQKKFNWDTQATSLLPSFKLGDADTTSRVQVKHLICACTGLPRQDLEWIFQSAGQSPDGVLKVLGTMQPTSKFGELFQYSNPMAAAAGFLGGHVAFPKLELGKAYDDAMRTLVFEPLGMKDTTFDFKRAQTGNFAVPHGKDVDGKTAKGLAAFNDSIVPARPAGGAWSTVNDMLKYVQMELAEGKLPDGKPYIAKEILFERRVPQVSINSDISYGMGLNINKTWGVKVVHHGGSMLGFYSDMMWLPEYGVGAVVLTNGVPGWIIPGVFQRKLLEVLFNGRAEADASLEARGKIFFENLAAERKLMTVPADAAESAKLAPRYVNAVLGELKISRSGASTFVDIGEWKSELASRKNPDGVVSFLTMAPGINGGFEFVVGKGDKKTLTIRDAQHEYVFEEKK